MPTIKQIAEKINIQSKNFKVGKLQEIRKKIKKLDRTPDKNIFNDNTIFDDYAYHYGGRKELQYNIEKEDNSNFRWGLAFSCKRNHNVQDITIFVPRIKKFNKFMRKSAKNYSDMVWWYWKNGIRSKDYKAGIIDRKIVKGVANKEEVLIFFGKHKKENNISCDEILKDFDRLLSLYKYVESENKIEIAGEKEYLNQLFDEDETNKSNTTPAQKEAIRKIRVRNSKVYRKLKKLYRGKCQLTEEQFTFKKTDGTLYSEAHHLIPLGEKGSDSIKNLIVVSPLIHKMLHYADVTPIELNKIKNNRLTITINGAEYTITWHPRHARSITKNLHN